MPLAYGAISFLGFQTLLLHHKGAILWSNSTIEDFVGITMENCIGIADYFDCQEDMESMDEEFFTVLVDDLLEFLWEYYMPL